MPQSQSQWPWHDSPRIYLIFSIQNNITQLFDSSIEACHRVVHGTEFQRLFDLLHFPVRSAHCSILDDFARHDSEKKFPDGSSERFLSKQNHAVKTFLLQAANIALHVRIQIRGPWW